MDEDEGTSETTDERSFVPVQAYLEGLAEQQEALSARIETLRTLSDALSALDETHYVLEEHVYVPGTRAHEEPRVYTTDLARLTDYLLVDRNGPDLPHMHKPKSRSRLEYSDVIQSVLELYTPGIIPVYGILDHHRIVLTRHDELWESTDDYDWSRWRLRDVTHGPDIEAVVAYLRNRRVRDGLVLDIAGAIARERNSAPEGRSEGWT